MAGRTVSTLKFVGSISVGLLTGLSYSLSTLTLPTLLHLPSAPLASKALASLATTSSLHLRALAGLSSSSFLLAYLLSPRSQKHPYLLWSSMFISSSLVADYFLPAAKISTTTTAAKKSEGRKLLSKSRQLDASYEVLSAGASDRDSEETVSEAEEVEEVNGEEVKEGMERFVVGSLVKAVLSGVGFVMAVVGVWGDGAAEVVIIEL